MKKDSKSSLNHELQRDIERGILSEAKEDQDGNLILPDGRVVSQDARNDNNELSIFNQIARDIKNNKVLIEDVEKHNAQKKGLHKRVRGAGMAICVIIGGVLPNVLINLYDISFITYGIMLFGTPAVCALTVALCKDRPTKMGRALKLALPIFHNSNDKDFLIAKELAQLSHSKESTNPLESPVINHLLESPVINHLLEKEARKHGKDSCRYQIPNIISVLREIRSHSETDTTKSNLIRSLEYLIIENYTEEVDGELTLSRTFDNQPDIQNLKDATNRNNVKLMTNFNAIFQGNLTEEQKLYQQVDNFLAESNMTQDLSLIIASYANDTKKDFTNKMKLLLSEKADRTRESDQNNQDYAIDIKSENSEEKEFQPSPSPYIRQINQDNPNPLKERGANHNHDFSV